MSEFKKVDSRELAIKAAKKHLTTNPTLSGGNYYILPDGTKLRVRKKENGRLAAENYNTKSKADKLRSQRETPKGDEEAAYVRSNKRAARQKSDNLIHQIAADGRPSIAEHNVRLASGGDNERMSISNPLYKDFKDAVETKVASRYGDQFTVDIDDVTGGVRAIPSAHHNKYGDTSKQKGFTFEPDQPIDLNKLEKFVKNGNGNGNGNGLANGVPNGNGGTAAAVIDSARQVVSVKPAYSHADILLKLLKGIA